MARLPGLVRLVLPDIGEDKPDQGGNAGQKARQIQQRDDGRPVEVETRVRRCGGRRNAVGHAILPWTSLFPARACADPFSNAIGSPHFRVKMDTCVAGKSRLPFYATRTLDFALDPAPT